MIEVAVLPMFHTGQDLALRRPLVVRLVRADHPRHIGQALRQLAKARLRGLLIPLPLHEDIQDVAVLIHRPPEIVPFTVDGEKHLIQTLRTPRSGPLVPQVMGIGLPALPAPIPHRSTGLGLLPNPSIMQCIVHLGS